MGGSAVFAVGCDMPLLNAELIEEQMQEWARVEADALVPVLGGRIEPLHAVYSSRCAGAAMRLIESGDRSLRALVRAANAQFWRPDPPRAEAFVNINDPDDWARFAALQQRGMTA